MTQCRAGDSTDTSNKRCFIAHVIVGLDNGGAENMLERLIRASSAEGKFRHAVISLTDIGPCGQRLLRAGVEVRAIGMGGMLGAFVGFWRLRAVLREFAPDIVQTWMYHADLLGGLAARSIGISRVIWGVRTTFVEYEGSVATSFLVQVCALLSRWVPTAIVCAAEASRRAHAGFGYHAARMRVIPNGYDVAHLAIASAQRPALRTTIGAIGESDIVIGASGRFNPVKDFPSFVRAAALVAAELANARFTMIGRGLDPENTELMAWLESAGVTSRFTLLGERTDLPECLAALDVFCLSSKSEAFPNVVCEAMGVSVPCVVTDVGDAALIVGNTGEIVPKEDAGALANAILRLARLGTEARQELGARARARLEREFSIDASRVRFESLYLELLAVSEPA